ncbi:MAG: hypothetical protein RIT52_88 [Pseudomonadota bacterium]|jgi:hypothetical protein
MRAASIWMIVAGLALGPAAAQPVGHGDASIIATAADAAQPRAEGHLKARCKIRGDGGTITFVAGKGGKVLLAALSAQPLANVRRDIWLSPRFSAAGQQGLATGTQDWAYLYDQNGDGKIDRMAFLIGPIPTEPDTADPGLPNISGDQIRVEGQAMLDRMMKAMRFGFWQAADEDGDGVPDTMAMPARRKDTGWYRGWAVFDRRATTEDAACRFIDRDGSAKGSCYAAAEPGDYEGDSLTTHVWVSDPGPIFSAIQSAATACKLKAADYRR